MPGIIRLTLREQVWATLREEILNGTLPAGARLGEVELAERLGVSRGTVREALRRLQQSGLVEGEDRAGLSVARFDSRQLRELFDVRAALEGLAATTIVKSGRGEDVAERLEKRLPEPERTASLAEVLDIDLGFHEALCREAGNATLLEMWHDLQDRMRIAVMTDPEALSSQFLGSAYHQPIVDALRSGDPEQARITMEQHMHGAAESWASRRD
ncbi:GntR family transcriptional regulator [Schaalia hyovaginalis]|uniref:GntR family transcriptional regulator n=1 Tax=Schaalia hyovaginalis TaxID=29316 RepID=UPI0026F069C1|nr:GntR family transcriptional regulator [Schaalia hyovaginalis]MCI6557266.1 GntR family transcriptional regulator [Schaalia hyovaginalis]